MRTKELNQRLFLSIQQSHGPAAARSVSAVPRFHSKSSKVMASQDDSPSQESETEPLKLVETPVEAVAEVRTPYLHKPDRSGYTRFISLQVVTSVRSAWQDLRSIPIGYRASQLRSLRKMIEDNITRFEEAVWKDLRKVRVKFKM